MGSNIPEDMRMDACITTFKELSEHFAKSSRQSMDHARKDVADKFDLMSRCYKSAADIAQTLKASKAWDFKDGKVVAVQPKT